MRRILIADDEPFIRTLLRETLEELEDEGVELLFAGDGLQAWNLVQQNHPDLVLLDVMMPEMSGYEVCEHIKQSPQFAGVYVIMLTAKGQEVDRERGMEVGADEYVTKPFDPDYILGQARMVVGAR